MMKAVFAVAGLVLAFSLCNLMGRRGNENTNSNAAPSPGALAESSPTTDEVPPPPPAEAASPRTANLNTNVRPPANVRPAVIIGAPPASAPGAPQSSMPGVNQNSAASVPRRPTTISGGVLNGKAIRLVQPAYPAIARAARASGRVNVQVLVDEQGNVVSATPVSGHPLLQGSAVAAARQSKFSPTMLSGQAVKVTGVIVYNFVLQ